MVFLRFLVSWKKGWISAKPFPTTKKKIQNGGVCVCGCDQWLLVSSRSSTLLRCLGCSAGNLHVGWKSYCKPFAAATTTTMGSTVWVSVVFFVSLGTKNPAVSHCQEASCLEVNGKGINKYRWRLEWLCCTLIVWRALSLKRLNWTNKHRSFGRIYASEYYNGVCRNCTRMYVLTTYFPAFTCELLRDSKFVKYFSLCSHLTVTSFLPRTNVKSLQVTRIVNM